MRRKQLAKITNVSSGSHIRKLSERIHAMMRAGIDVVDLTASEPDFPTPDHIKKAGIAAIEHNLTKNIHGNATADLLDAISKKFKSENNVHWSPAEILISQGEKESIFIALRTICDPGSEVIILSPYCRSYPEITRSVGAKPIIVGTTEATSFKVSPRQLRNALSLKTKACIFNSPANPAGVVYSREEIEDIAFVLADAGLYVISDERFEYFVYDEVRHVSIGAIDSLREATVTVNGLSQAFSMSGWPLGYMGAHKSIIDKASEMQDQVASNVSAVSQKAALAAISSPPDHIRRMQEEFRHRRNYVVGEFDAMKNISCIRPKAGLYVFPRVHEFYGTSFGNFQIRSDVNLCEFLLSEGKVATLPGSAFGSSDNIRISLAAPSEELQKGLQRIDDCLNLLRY